MKGLEPSRDKALVPKTSVSTNFTTSADIRYAILTELQAQLSQKHSKNALVEVNQPEITAECGDLLLGVR